MIIISNISLRHQKFVEEMRSVLESNNNQNSTKKATSKNESNKKDADAALREELDRKFDELFGPFFDDDEN